MIWTAEHINEMLALWRQGRSTSEIARHFSTTKNSIIGKLHRERVRLGLKTENPRPPRDRRKSVQSDTVQKRSYTRREAMLTLPDRAESVLRIVSPPPAVPDQGQLASIVDVTGCKWPVKDDPDFVGGVAFCNHARGEGPYCPFHKHQSIAHYSAALIKQTTRSAIHLYTKASA